MRLLLLVLAFFVGASGDGESERESLWRKLFVTKTKQQKEAVLKIGSMEDPKKQESTFKQLLEAMCRVQVAAKQALKKAEFDAGDHFPEDQEVVDALSQVLENAVFLAQLVLYHPDIAKPLALKATRTTKPKIDPEQCKAIFYWSIVFANATGFFDPGATELMNLASQEIGIISPDPDFVNPYRQKTVREKVAQEEFERALKDRQRKKEKRKLKRGPQMTRAEL